MAAVLGRLLADPVLRDELSRRALSLAPGGLPGRLDGPTASSTASRDRPGPGLEEVGMKFCMLTTFFGSHSFGGDAAFVDRLSRAFARHGHEVHVIHCRDAFEISRGDQTPAPLRASPGRGDSPAAEPLWRALPAGDAATGQPLFKARCDPPSACLDPARRGPLPQPLTDRGSGPARRLRAPVRSSS